MSLLNELRANLISAEEVRDAEWAKRLKTRIKEEEARESQIADLPTAEKVEDILAAVGEDPVLAAAALETEQAKDKPRKTLVSALEALTAPPAPTAPEAEGSES